MSFHIFSFECSLSIVLLLLRSIKRKQKILLIICSFTLNWLCHSASAKQISSFLRKKLMTNIGESVKFAYLFKCYNIKVPKVEILSTLHMSKCYECFLLFCSKSSYMFSFLCLAKYSKGVY